MHLERRGDPAEIDLAADPLQVPLLDVPFGTLPAHLATDVPHIADGNTKAPEDHRSRRSAAGDVPPGEDRLVAEVHEFPGFTVAPPMHAEAYAEVRLDRTATPHRQESDRRGERDDAQLQVLFYLRQILPLEPAVDAW